PMQLNMIQQAEQLYSFFNNLFGSSSPLFAPTDILEAADLITALSSTGTTPLDAYLWTLIPTADQQSLLSTTETQLQLQTILAGDLNSIINQSKSIYNQQLFTSSKVTLSAATQSLLNSGPVGSVLVTLNRMLLDDAFPNDLATLVTNDKLDKPVIGQPQAQYIDNLNALFTKADLAASALGNWTDYIGPTLGLPENVANTYVGAASEAGDDEPNVAGQTPTETPGRASISGSFDWVTTINTGKAWIGQNAQINTDAAYASPNRTFDARNLIDPVGLAATIAAQADPASKYLWGQLSHSDQTTLSSSTSTSAQLQAVLLNELNTVVSGSSLYAVVSRFYCTN